MNLSWPKLSYLGNEKTYYTFLLWTQIVGKLKVATLPWVNHAWSTSLHLTPTGLTTMNLPYKDKNFEVKLNLVKHHVLVEVQTGETKSFDLHDGLTVAQFYRNLFLILADFGIDVTIHGSPNEVTTPIPFHRDRENHHYNAGEIENFHKALLNVQNVFNHFRARFRGKNSPIHFFWGAIDLAVTRFSGRIAPPHPGGIPNLPDHITRECYDRELSSVGFWPGNESFPQAAFYSYHYPEPEDFKNQKVKPDTAYYHENLGEFILTYADVINSAQPEQAILDFLNSTYLVAAELKNWNRERLESTQF